MNKFLIPIIFVPLLASADINNNYSFPTVSLDEFKNQVKAIDTYHQARMKESKMRSKAIQDRLLERQMHFGQRYNSIGDYRKVYFGQ
jgi:hypothetical protein